MNKKRLSTQYTDCAVCDLRPSFHHTSRLDSFGKIAKSTSTDSFKFQIGNMLCSLPRTLSNSLKRLHQNKTRQKEVQTDTQKKEVANEVYDSERLETGSSLLNQCPWFQRSMAAWDKQAREEDQHDCEYIIQLIRTESWVYLTQEIARMVFIAPCLLPRTHQPIHLHCDIPKTLL